MSTTDLNIILDRIRANISLSEIVGRDIKLTRKGREFVGNCPFHSEKTASFFVNDDKGKYYCFGCGAHGDVVTYIMNSRGQTFRQALELLAMEAGIKLPEYKSINTPHRNNDIVEIMNECSLFFEQQLFSNQQVMQYCLSRDLTPETIKAFRIGYCPANVNILFESLKSHKFKYADIIKTQVFKDKNTSRFGGRLIFPIINKKGEIIAFGGRSLQSNEGAKYVNSPESNFFQKKETLYGIHLASKNVSDKKKPYVVVEGYIDVIMMHRFGFDTVVASMGTAFSKEHLFKLWQHCSEPIICFDGDTAGYNAMIRAAYTALECISPGKSLRFCTLPTNCDPDSYLRENSKDSMQKLLEQSVYLIDFLWNHFLDLYDLISNKTPEHIAAWKKDIISKINTINNVELKDMYYYEIKERIYQLRRNKTVPKSHPIKSYSVNKKNNALLREAILLYTVLKYEEIFSYVAEKLAHISFTDKEFGELRDKLLCEFENSANIDYTKLAEIAGKYCNFDNYTSDKIIEFWDDVFENHVGKTGYYRDIKSAKEDVKYNMNESAWERLKALKLNLVAKKK